MSPEMVTLEESRSKRKAKAGAMGGWMTRVAETRTLSSSWMTNPSMSGEGLSLGWYPMPSGRVMSTGRQISRGSGRRESSTRSLRSVALARRVRLTRSTVPGVGVSG